MKYFVDYMPKGSKKWEEGAIAMPKEDAIALSEELKKSHPNCMVKIEPIDTASA